MKPTKERKCSLCGNITTRRPTRMNMVYCFMCVGKVKKFKDRILLTPS